MPTPILMPALSPTMEKGKLARWLKQEGDEVKAGDVIAEIETDKATMEVEAVDEGKLGKIMVAEGTEDVPVNAPIAVLLGEGEDASAIAPAEKQPPAAATPSPQPSPPRGEGDGRPEPTPKKPEGASQTLSPAGRGQGEGAAVPVKGNGAEARIFASPLAKRIAKERGIELASLMGSGPHGRIILRDVEGAKAIPKAAAAPVAAPAAAAMSDEAIRKLFEEGSYEVVPHDNMRKIVARRLTESKQTIPHFYLTIDCRIDTLLEVRERLNAHAPRDKDKNPAWKLSVNDFVIKALALALQRVPEANVTWTEGGMLKHRYSDVGVAVAVEGGLFTPVVRKAETKTLSQISNEMKDLAARARKRKLAPHEYQGGSTAVSNLGMYGIPNFSAVINPPHATILAVGMGEKRAVVTNDQVQIATIMTCTLSTDHRAVDGALGAQLLAAFKDLIQEPALMLV